MRARRTAASVNAGSPFCDVLDIVGPPWLRQALDMSYGIFQFTVWTHQTAERRRVGFEAASRVGDDLSKPHKLEFQLRFPTKSAAEQAAPALRVAAYEIVIAQDGREGWSVVAIKMIVSDEEGLLAAHNELDAAAAAAGGHYDGWAMAAEDPNV